jgi:hypothetical protein
LFEPALGFILVVNLHCAIGIS